MIGRGVVAGGEVDGAVQFGAHDFVGDGGSGSKRIAEQSTDAVLLEDIDSQLREFLRVEACVIADENGGIFLPRGEVASDGGHDQADVGKCEIIGDEAAPAGSTKLDGRNGHAEYSSVSFEV